MTDSSTRKSPQMPAADDTQGASRQAQRLASGLSEPQRQLLLAGDDDEVNAGIGTWFLLRAAGLLDGDFNITDLGRQVRAAIRAEAGEPGGKK